MKRIKSPIKKWIFFGLVTSFIFTTYSCELNQPSTTTPNPLTELPAGFSAVGSFQQVNLAGQGFKPLFLNFLLPPALASSSVIRDASGRSVIINSAWIAFSHVELKESQFTDGTEGTPPDLVYPGPYYVDLLSATRSVLDTELMRQLSFRRIFVSLHKQDDLPMGVPTELADNSIFLEGTIDGIPFIYKSSETNALQVSGPNAIDPAGRGLLLLEFHIGRIIKKLDLSSINSATEISNSNKYSVANPCPTIDPGLSDIYSCFKVGLETESNLGVDMNGDFKLNNNDESLK